MGLTATKTNQDEITIPDSPMLPSTAITAKCPDTRSPAMTHLEGLMKALADKDTPERQKYLSLLNNSNLASSSSRQLNFSSAQPESLSFEPKFNKQKVDISKSAIDGPVDEDAFRTYSRGYLEGEQRRKSRATKERILL